MYTYNIYCTHLQNYTILNVHKYGGHDKIRLLRNEESTETLSNIPWDFCDLLQKQASW